LIDAMDSEPTT